MSQIFNLLSDDARQYDLGKLLHIKNVMPTSAKDSIFDMRPHMPPIFCIDGTRLSVQAGVHLYCTPRSNMGPYTHVEVGFPSSPPPECWEPYNDGDSGVWAFVPVELVHFYIAGHGGIDYDKTFSTTAV